MLSRCGCEWQQDRLADDDAEDTGDALALYRGAVSPPSSVVRTYRTVRQTPIPHAGKRTPRQAESIAIGSR